MKIDTYTARALGNRNLLDSPDNIEKLISIGKSLHRLYEKQCNGFCDYQGNWDEKASDRADKREENLNKKAQAIAKEIGAYIYMQGDPRGATIYIDNKPIPDNNYTQAVCLV